MTTYQLWNVYFQIIQFLVTSAIGIYVWWSNKEKVTTTRFSTLEDRMTRVETKVKSMPVCGNHGRMEDNDIKLFKRFDDLHGDIRELTGGVKGLTRSVDMINEYLLKERK